MSDDGPRIEVVDESAEKEADTARLAAVEAWAAAVSLTEEEGCVYAKFGIPQGVNVKGRNADIQVEWSERRLKIFVKSTGAILIEGPLRYPIRVPAAGSNKWDSCETRWFVEDDKWFVVQLEKVDKNLEWRRLFTPEYYQELAEAGNVTEQINMAILMDQSHKFEEGFKWWKRAADQGNASAQTILGSKYQDGTAVAKDEEKSQEYFIKAALNPNPHPHAMLTVGFWLREGSLGAFGKQVMMGYSHRQIWDRCIQLFPGHKYALMAAQLMAQEYLQEGNVQKAEQYARAAGIELKPQAAQKAAPQQQVSRARPAKLDPLPVTERVREGTSLAQESASTIQSLSNYNFWSSAAWAAAGVATAVVLYRNWSSDR